MLDQSGNGYHAIQTVSGRRPVYRTDGTLHWLEGDGVDDFLRNTTVNFVMETSSTLVAGLENKTRSQGIFKAGESGVGTGDRFILFRVSNSSFAAGDEGTSIYNFGIPANTPFLTEIHHRFSGVDFILDGTTKESTVTNIGSVPVTNDIILFATRSDIQFLDGRFYGAIMRTPEMSSEDKVASREYLANLSGVTL